MERSRSKKKGKRDPSAKGKAINFAHKEYATYPARALVFVVGPLL